MKNLAFLAACLAVLLSACASNIETLAERPAMKCDVVEAPTGSRIPRRECAPEPTRRQ